MVWTTTESQSESTAREHSPRALASTLQQERDAGAVLSYRGEDL